MKSLTNWPQFKEFHKCNDIQRRIKSTQKATSGILDWLWLGTFARVPNNKLKCTDQESLTAFQSSSQPWECLKWLDPPGNARSPKDNLLWTTCWQLTVNLLTGAASHLGRVCDVGPAGDCWPKQEKASLIFCNYLRLACKALPLNTFHPPVL